MNNPERPTENIKTTNELIKRNFRQSFTRISQGVVGLANLVDATVLVSGKVAATAAAIPDSFWQALKSQEKNLMDFRRDHIDYINNNPNAMRALAMESYALIALGTKAVPYLSNIIR